MILLRLLCLALALISTAASAQSPVLPGPGLPVAGGGGGGSTLSLISQTSASGCVGGTVGCVYFLGANPQTISGIDIGAASANRRVIIAMLQSRSGFPVTGITINTVGVTFSQVDNNTGYNGSITIGYADVPTGTTASVAVTGGGASGDESQDVFYIYTVDKSTLVNGSPTFGPAKTNGTPATTLTATAATGANGFVITAFAGYGFGTITGQNISASTETYTNDGLNGASQNVSAISTKKSGSSANTPSSVTWSWTNSNNAVVAIYAWN